MPKKKAAAPPRIYIIVPETVDVPVGRGVNRVKMDSRWAAQAVHAAIEMVNHERDRGTKTHGWGNLPTIVLAVRNSRELEKVWNELHAHRDKTTSKQAVFFPYGMHKFEDVQPDFWGTKGKVWTAICLTPVDKALVEPVIGHLEKYED